MRADARIHSHTSHYRETEHGRSERRSAPAHAPRFGMAFPQRGFSNGRSGGQGGNASSHGSAPRPATGSQGQGMKRPRDGNEV